MSKLSVLREHVSTGNVFVFNFVTCGFLQRRLLRMNVLREEFERREPRNFRSVWIALKQFGEVERFEGKGIEKDLLRLNKSYFLTTILHRTSKLLQGIAVFPCAFWLPKEKNKPLFFELDNGWFLIIAPIIPTGLRKKRRVV